MISSSTITTTVTGVGYLPVGPQLIIRVPSTRRRRGRAYQRPDLLSLKIGIGSLNDARYMSGLLLLLLVVVVVVAVVVAVVETGFLPLLRLLHSSPRRNE